MSVQLGALVWGSLKDWPLITHNYSDPEGPVPTLPTDGLPSPAGEAFMHAHGTQSICTEGADGQVC